MAVQRLTHVGICVSDLERSLPFYRDALGFRELGTLDVTGEEASRLLAIADVKLRAVYLERDDTRIELLCYGNPGAPVAGQPVAMDHPGFTHLSFRVDDLESATAAIASCGGRVLGETRIDNPRFGAKAIFATDPDGTRIELVEAPGDPAALPGGAG
jgi:catechol 2,3-dioxygenase-like lactoylglutathione lyase family enzyme